MKEIKNGLLVEPKNTKEISMEEIESKYQYVTVEKGTNGLEKYFDYYITDEWVEIEKKGRNTESSDDRFYLGVKTVRIDKEGKLVQQKGALSLNKLVHPLPVYREINGSYIIEYVQQIRGIPGFKAEPLSIMEYIQKYLVGKCLRSSEDTFQCAIPDFVDRRPVFFTPDGNKFKEKEVCYYDVDETDMEALLGSH